MLNVGSTIPLFWGHRLNKMNTSIAGSLLHDYGHNSTRD